MRLVYWIASLVLGAAPAFAQEITVEPAKALSQTDKSTAFQWLVTAVFLVGCLVVAFKPAKRSKLE